jgi:hypothetical protein
MTVPNARCVIEGALEVENVYGAGSGATTRLRHAFPLAEDEENVHHLTT